MAWLIPLAAAAVGAGSAIYSSNKQSKAINNASGAQQVADQAAIEEQRRQFDVTQGNLAPWLAAGKAALGGEMDLLGLGGHPGISGTPAAPGAPGGAPGGQNWSGYLQAYPDVMQEAQRVTADGEFPSPEAYAQYHFQNFGQGEGRTVPTYGATDGAGGPGGTPRTPGTPGVDAATAQQQAIDQLKGSPLYQSLYRNGQDAILANGAATGGLRGGNIQRSLANFGSDTLASVIQQQLANLGSISGQGNNTGTNLGQLGAGASTNIGNLTVNRGGAQAGGILGSAAVGGAGLNAALAALLNGTGQSYSQYRASQAAVAPYSGLTGVQPYDPINGLF